MGACRGAPVTKQADIEKARAKQKKKEAASAKPLTKAQLAAGPVRADELAKATGAARWYLLFVKRVQALEKSFIFQGAITAVIFIAAVLIGFATLPVADTIPEVMGVFEWTINGIFIFEIAVKMIAKKWRPQAYFYAADYEWAWNNFDFMVVVLSLLGGEQIQLLRLLRLLRVLKLLHTFPTLAAVTQSLLNAFTSVGYVMLMFIVINFVFACAGMTLFRRNDKQNFGSFVGAMMTIWRIETQDGWVTIMDINTYGCDVYGYSGGFATYDNTTLTDFPSHMHDGLGEVLLARA